jgi:hypothetical protein
VGKREFLYRQRRAIDLVEVKIRAVMENGLVSKDIQDRREKQGR